MRPGARIKIITALPAASPHHPPALAALALGSQGACCTPGYANRLRTLLHGHDLPRGPHSKASNQASNLSFFSFFFYPSIFSLFFNPSRGRSPSSPQYRLSLASQWGIMSRGIIESRTPRPYNGSSVRGKYCTICLHAAGSLPFPLGSPAPGSRLGLWPPEMGPGSEK